MHPMMNIAERAARRAGDVIIRGYEQRHRLNVERKSAHDYVTEIDLQAEQVIVKTLRDAFPDHAILAEEGQGQAGNNKHRWIIDPLDGTTNFLHGHPQFAVSIAFLEDDKLTHAIVYNPLTQENYTASRGSGAMLNNKRIRISGLKNFPEALLGTGFPYSNDKYLPLFMETFQALILQTSGIRRCGSAALDLAFLAAGRLDGFWEFDLKPWDIAAGALIVQEAGGLVSNLQGSEKFLDKGHILAGSPRIHKQLLEIFRPIMENHKDLL